MKGRLFSLIRPLARRPSVHKNRLFLRPSNQRKRDFIPVNYFVSNTALVLPTGRIWLPISDPFVHFRIWVRLRCHEITSIVHSPREQKKHSSLQ